MDFENLKLSNNKYDRYIYESIIKTCDELDLDETHKELFLKNYVEKKNKKLLKKPLKSTSELTDLMKLS